MGEQFDVILIGSGIGSLTCASLLTQLRGKRVLVLERHFKLGGFTHTFQRRGRYSWDVGVHYIGKMTPGELDRAMFDLVTRGEVKWSRMPDPYDIFMYPDFTFGARSGVDNLKADLMELFPKEKKGIENYFSDLEAVRNWVRRVSMAQQTSGPQADLSDLFGEVGAKRALMKTGDYLDQNIRDKHLKALLVSQWGDYGLPPSQSALAIHAIVTSHYFDGGWYPVGGANTIPRSIAKVVESGGGQLLVNHTVKEIIIHDGRAIGVRAEHKRGKYIEQVEYFADHIVSGAGALITYNQLLPEEYALPVMKELSRLPAGTASVTLYLGLKEDPRLHGHEGSNYWIFSGYDHDKLYENRNALLDGEAGMAFLSFPSVKDPTAHSHTAEIVSFLDAEPLKHWTQQPWRRRGPAYEELKGIMSEALLNFVDEHHPGLSNLVDYQELSTPLTTENFTGHPDGIIYGLPAVPERYRMKWFGPHTPVTNLYLTGSDALSHGVTGALMGGVVTAALIMGSARSFMEIIAEARRFAGG